MVAIADLALNENTQKVLTLLYTSGPLSKPELAERGGMAWATIVKIIDRLVEARVVDQVGTSKRPSLPGKHAVLYNLTDHYPLVVGIDVEYHLTTITLSSLRRQILASASRPTPGQTDAAILQQFLVDLIREFLDQSPDVARDQIIGVGIGVPTIGLPLWKRSDGQSPQQSIGEFVETQIGMPVRIHDNTLSYTVYEKWTNQAFSEDDFLFVSIRTGVGSGIFVNGTLLEGHQGLAGMVGHLITDPTGPACRCGRRGCLETVSNQYYLYERYRTEVLGKEAAGQDPPVPAVHAALPDLFTKARRGNRNALTIVANLAENLAIALGPAIMVLNPPVVIISGFFGADGDVLIPILRERIAQRVLHRIDYSLRYWEFDPAGHNLGAALLFYRDFLTPVLNPQRGKGNCVAEIDDTPLRTSRR